MLVAGGAVAPVVGVEVEAGKVNVGVIKVVGKIHAMAVVIGVEVEDT